jgi:RecA/RadA recombinase
MAKQFSFDELDGVMSKVDSLGSVMTKNNYSKIDEWIGTGNYLLNAQISGSIFKGIPNSRSIVFSGVSGCGKTFMILNALREAQAMGYYAIYGDSEAAVDEELMVKFNIDPTRVRYQPLKTVIQTRHFIANLCQQLREKRDKGFEVPKIMMIIDSLGNLATEKETADALSGSDKRDMTKQQNLKSMFRIITTDLAELKIPLLVTNHVYASIGGYFPSNVQSGGTGAIYNASIILEFTKAGLKDGDAEAADAGQAKTGLIITSKVVKNRFVKPIPIKFHLSFYKGMNPYVGLENYVSWETCGIGRGKLIEEILEEPQWEDAAKTVPKMYRGKQKVERTKTGEYIFERDDKANTFAIKHLGKTIKGSAIFCAEVFTREVLEEVDKVIGPIFHFPKTVSDVEELEAMMDEDDDDTSTSHEKLFNQAETVAEVNKITNQASGVNNSQEDEA